MELCDTMPPAGLIRLPQIIGDEAKGIPALIPVAKSTWYEGIAAGRYPKPVKLGRASAWRRADILALAEGGTR